MKRLSSIVLALTLAACTTANTIQEPVYTFDHKGTLSRNNPGLTPGMWYLVYEMPGQPAIPVRLWFDDDTLCIDGEKKAPCERSVFEKGLKVQIRGIDENGAVNVREMELL